MSQEPHRAELGALQRVFEGLGHATELLEASGEVAYPTLLVEVGGGSGLQLAVNYYPLAPEQLPNTLLLQYFVALPIKLDEPAMQRLRAWLPEANNKVILGHFGLTATDRQLHFRYVQTLGQGTPLEAQAVADVLKLVTYTPLLFSEILTDLAEGRMTPAQATANLEARWAAL